MGPEVEWMVDSDTVLYLMGSTDQVSVSCRWDFYWRLVFMVIGVSISVA